MTLDSIFSTKRVNPQEIDKIKSKIFAQHFTSLEIAQYMSSLISVEKKDYIRILDAGGGDGILSIAAIIQCVNLEYDNIHVKIYEIDKEMIKYIKYNFIQLTKSLTINKINLTYEIICQDFVLSRPDIKNKEKEFDVCIINPPYFKYKVATSPYSKKTQDLFKGDPNIYASFMGICINMLADNGQLISITPRSFTNGLYFKHFRQFITNNCSLNKVHIFNSRNKVFKNSSVLQETIICSFTKKSQISFIEIRSSESESDLDETLIRSYPSNLILNYTENDMTFNIPEDDLSADIMKKALSLDSDFSSSGYYISTGPVVEHRTKEYLVEKKNEIPLFRPHNISFMKTEWGDNHKKDISIIFSERTKKILLKNSIYVLIKRMSSKDEKKRLTAGIYNSLDNYEYIGFGNKLNYIGLKNEEMNIEEATGLSAVLNSTFMDNYFRCISGSTQVNATDIRLMKFPSRNIVKKIGTSIIKKSYSQDIIDKIVLLYLFEKEV